MTNSPDKELPDDGDIEQFRAILANRIGAHIEVMRALSETESLRELTPILLREISRSLGFEMAILWRVDGEFMVCEEIWHSANVKAENFLAKTRAIKLKAGTGLPGRVWTSKLPVWVDEISNENASIPPSAAKEHFRSSGCVPIKLKDEVLGAMEFFNRCKRLPDAKIQELMLGIGSQVGLFIERNRTIEALKQCEERYRFLADNEPNVLLTVDEDFTITFANKATESTFGYLPSELRGKSLMLLIPEYFNRKHGSKQVSSRVSLPTSTSLPGVHRDGSALKLEVSFSKFSGKEFEYSKSKKFATGVICDVTEKHRLASALHESEEKLQDLLATNSSNRVVAEAPAMRGLLERVKKAASSYAHILVQGETGSGKECIAHIIHHQSPLAAKPFIARNCAAIPANLFESEMFGHKKGAFTGADRDRRGAFLEADGGTLFLDEIGELEYSLQTKLLRAIQEKCILPVGGDKELFVNPRIICATNKNLLEYARTKKFREDLYYRLVTVLLVVPPLRERAEDIIPLARHFIGLTSAWTRTLSPEAEQRLLQYDWPGNVRELRSLMDQAVIFAIGNVIQADELDFPDGNGEDHAHSNAMAIVERRHILQVFKTCRGNKTETAKTLGIARSTLVLKLKEYELSKKTKAMNSGTLGA